MSDPLAAGTLDRPILIASLEAAPRLVRALADQVTSEEAWRAPAPGEWSIGEVVRHLVAGDRDTFLPRLQRMLTETRPVFEQRAAPPPGPAGDLPDLLDAFARARGAAIELLGGLDEPRWRRAGVSPSRGALTVDTYARTMADHDTEHLRQIHDVREALGLLPRRCEARRPVPLGALAAELEAGPARFEALAAGRPAGALRRRPRPGEWCANEVIAHLAHVETELFLPRLRRILAEDRPVFPSFSPEAWARERDRSEGPFAAALEAFARARRLTVALLEELPGGAGDRLGLSAHFGPVTLAQYATHVADHDREHYAQMEACLTG